MDGDSSNQPGASGNQPDPSEDPNNSGWQFDPKDRDIAQPDESPDTQMLHQDEYLPQPGTQSAPNPEIAVRWTASEFIAHQKSMGWYSLLILVTIVVAGVVFIATKDKITTFVILFVALVFGIVAARKPRTIEYTVDDSGLTIGQHFYEYGQFRSFAVVQEGAFTSLVFMPLKRFMPLITVYYDPKDEQKILTILSNRMPLDTHQLDFMEQLMRRIRF